MKLTQKLLCYLNRVFDKDPHQVLALRLQYDGSAMTWLVADGVLTTAVTGGSGTPLNVDLSLFSVAQLAVFLAAQPGYSVPYVDADALVNKSALVLIDASGNINTNNGDHFYGYTSVLWAYMDAMANQLTVMRAAISEALLEMSVATADGEWLDFHGVYYDVLRNQDEADAQYAARIVAEVLQARGNGIVIGLAIAQAVSATTVSVPDYDVVTTSGGGVKSYGLFDVTVDSSVDAEMGPLQDALIRQIIEALRDAGTFLRTLKYIRRVPWTAYVGAALSTGQTIHISFRALVYDGTYRYDGSQVHDGVAST